MSETVQALLRYRVDLDKPAGMTVLREPLATEDKLAYGLQLTAVSGGQMASLEGVQAIGYMVRADGATVATDMATGTAEGVTVWLPDSCYTVPGRFSLVVKLLGETARRAVLWLEGHVSRSRTDSIVDPEHVVPSLDAILQQIDAMETATAEGTAAAAAARNAAQAAGTAAMAATDAATLANGAAQNALNAATLIDSMTASASPLPAGSAPTATVTEADGHKVIAFGIPKGDKGDKGETGEQGPPGNIEGLTVNGHGTDETGGIYLTGQDIPVADGNDTRIPAALERRDRAYNLLDNSDFAHPVNQRGASSYTGAVYGIDRWLAYHAQTVVAVMDGGVAVSGNRLYQVVPPDRISVDKVYTLAAMRSDGGMEIYSAKFSDPLDDTQGTALYTSNGAYRVRLDTGKTWVWAALYEGAYAVETLPAYVPKGYAAELAECQRYLQTMTVVAGAGASTARRVILPFQPMRIANPTVTYTLATGSAPTSVGLLDAHTLDVTGPDGAVYSHLYVNINAEL